MKNSPKGVITALVTPFKKGELDLKSFSKLIRHQLEQGVQGFVINGTTAESPSLSLTEVRTLFQMAKTEVAGQVPLILGASSNSTARTCEMIQEVCAWGPDALLVVVPYYNKPPQRGLLQHFKRAAQTATVPIIAYDVPGRTVIALEPQTTGELSQDLNICGIKDATGDLEKLESLKKVVRKGFCLLSGDDPTCVEFCARGGEGVISVSSHILGRETREFIERAQSGDKAAVGEYTAKYGEFMKWLYCEANPIGVKMALHWMGILDSPELRLPMVELDGKFHGDFKACLKKLGKIS